MNAPETSYFRAPIAAHQAFESNRPALGGGMHKAVLANVDADMGVLLAGGVEKHKVARKSVLCRNLSAGRPHLLNRARQCLARGPTHHIDHQATAIKPTRRSIATPSIRCAHQRECVKCRLGKALFCGLQPCRRELGAACAGDGCRGRGAQKACTARDKKRRRHCHQEELTAMTNGRSHVDCPVEGHER